MRSILIAPERHAREIQGLNDSRFERASGTLTTSFLRHGNVDELNESHGALSVRRESRRQVVALAAITPTVAPAKDVDARLPGGTQRRHLVRTHRNYIDVIHLERLRRGVGENALQRVDVTAISRIGVFIRQTARGGRDDARSYERQLCLFHEKHVSPSDDRARYTAVECSL